MNRSAVTMGVVWVLLALAACAPWPVTPPAAVSTDTGNSRGQAAAELAEGEMGVPYLFGGSTPAGFDCSGLVYYVYAQEGITVPRTAEAQFDSLPRVDGDALQPGDLVFFRSESGSQVHVGIYAGSHWFVHAPESGGSVSGARLDNPYWHDRYLGAARPVTGEPKDTDAADSSGH